LLAKLGERLDELIVGTVPDVHKAVKWNQPFYGHEGEGWFLAFRCYTNYVQLQFFRGTSLDPMPPKASKHDEVRCLDIRAYWLAVMTGMRRNELLGLRWTDLDMTWSSMPPPGGHGPIATPVAAARWFAAAGATRCSG
jgi:hypothetical protein